MKQFIIALTVMLTASGAYAQEKKSLVDIDKELKQTKSSATAIALIESIAETTPQTDADVAALGQLMDKYPAQGQRAIGKIKDPKLAKAVMKECDRQVAKFKADKDKDWKTLPDAQRQEKFNALLNSHIMIATLGSMKNKDALPFLKQYITPEYDGVLSYEASKAIGRIAPDDPAVFKELWEKQGVKSISYNAYGQSVLKEVAQKMQDPNIPQAEKNRLLGKAKVSLLSGKEPEEKKLIKEILLNHPNQKLRGEASIAMVHAVIHNPEESDKDFLLAWVKKEKSLAVWDAPYVIDRVWDARFIPLVFEMLKTQSEWMPRGNLAQLIGRRQIKESLPHLKDCVKSDKDSNVRAECRNSYYKISGEMPIEFHPEDVTFYEKKFSDPHIIDFYSKIKDSDSDKIKHNALKASFEEFKKR